jgi:hypothetical protein
LFALWAVRIALFFCLLGVWCSVYLRRWALLDRFACIARFVCALTVLAFP